MRYTPLNKSHNMNHLDDLLRDYRQKYKLSQAALAEILDVRTATVADWERRKAFPSWENLKKVCDKLGLGINGINPSV
jgi:transcriptional regulator with XRE-family HTH domain